MSQPEPALALGAIQVTANWAAALIALIVGLVGLVFSIRSDGKAQRALDRADKAIEIELLRSKLEILDEYRQILDGFLERAKFAGITVHVLDRGAENESYLFKFAKNDDASFDEAIRIVEDAFHASLSFYGVEEAMVDNINKFSDSLLFAEHYRRQREKSDYTKKQTADYVGSCLVEPWAIIFIDIRKSIEKSREQHRERILAIS